ncbi:MAG: hypothetical protein F6K22_12085 [Okeania sp. SIO2F4]|uniref:hypothetical protein n=1 Tax=Okeania sp. SIO2F4 TaxID=2607790 RepID=UPI001429D9D7|nr:hypothetical protein [Okeania sp. SIO2F4]NES03519.1 hypothetical protein [Okeania sp. SIO2F4]
MKLPYKLLLILAASALFFPQPTYAEDSKKCDPEPTDMVVNYGDLLTCSLQGSGDSDIFRLKGTAGDRIIFRVSSVNPSDVGNDNENIVEVIDPEGKTLASQSSHGVRFELALEQTGKYTFVVSNFVPVDYLIEVSCVTGSCLAKNSQ